MHICIYRPYTHKGLVYIFICVYLWICILIERCVSSPPPRGGRGRGSSVITNANKAPTQSERAALWSPTDTGVCQLSPYSHSHRSLADRAFSLASFPSHTFPPSAFSPSVQPSLITSSLILPSRILSWRHADRRWSAASVIRCKSSGENGAEKNMAAESRLHVLEQYRLSVGIVLNWS